MKDSMRMKRRVSLNSVEVQGQESMVRYGSLPAGQALDHFMRWADGRVTSRKQRELVQELHEVMALCSFKMSVGKVPTGQDLFLP